MTRLLSGVVLALAALALVWLSSDLIFLMVVAGVLLLAFGEYATLSRASGLNVPETPAALAAVLTAAAFSRLAYPISWVSLDIIVMAAFVVLGMLTLTNWREGPDAVGLASSALFPVFYLGLPFGAVIAIREAEGREVLLLMIFTVVVSDTAQLYSGRLFGRRPLAPAISPKKTIEGAVGGFIFGALFFAAAGFWWLPDWSVAIRAAIGVVIVAAGMAGGLFESMLKRSADVKDSSSLIPGHGGILDRVDAMLFVAPVYYIILKFV
mgnify:CR=1 FL=1